MVTLKGSDLLKHIFPSTNDVSENRAFGGLACRPSGGHGGPPYE